MIKSISLENRIEALIKNKEYNLAIHTLKKEILNIFIMKIRDKDDNYIYTNIIELINKSKILLDRKSNTQLRKFYYLSKEDCCDEYEVYQLIEIYSNIRKWKNDFWLFN